MLPQVVPNLDSTNVQKMFSLFATLFLSAYFIWYIHIENHVLKSFLALFILFFLSEVAYDQEWWSILGICAQHLTHPRCTHTQQWTHTPGAVGTGSHLCCGARGAVGGLVPCSRAPQSWYWGWRERCIFTPPTNWDSNSQPFNYESDSLTIRPQ